MFMSPRVIEISELIKMAGVVAIYSLFGKLAASYSPLDWVTSVALPPSGLMLATLLLGGNRYLPAIFLGGLLSPVFMGHSLGTSAIIATGNTLEAAFGAWMLRRASFSLGMRSLRDYIKLLLLAGFLCIGASTIISAGLLHATSSHSPDDLLQRTVDWWMADVLGFALFAPLILVWRHFPSHWRAPARVFEVVAAFGLAFAVGQAVFAGWLPFGNGNMFRGYLQFLFAIWIAVRLGLHGTVLFSCMTAAQGLWGALHGVGFFADEVAQGRMFNYWVYTLVLTTVGMALASYFAERRDSEKLMRTWADAFEHCAHGIAMTKAATNSFLVCNPAYASMLGRPPAEVAGSPILAMYAPSEHANVIRSLAHSDASGQARYEAQMVRKDGSVFPAQVDVVTIADDSGYPSYRVSTIQDISKRRSDEARIEYLPQHDQLTSLPNRSLALDRLNQALVNAERSKSQVAIAHFDLDNFKVINDSLGVHEGDLLLKAVSERLQDCVRDTDTVSRRGGDEFLIILTNIRDVDAVVSVVAKISAALAANFIVGPRDLTVTASIGIALYPEDAGEAESLVRCAEAAMYQAKHSGRNNYRFFDDEMNADATEQLRIRSDLRRAMRQSEFILHYQPQISLTTMQVIGAEALIRWNAPGRGRIYPSEFIGTAEESGLIVQMGEWVLHEACRQAQRWRQDGLLDMVMAVNLSAVQFRRGNLEEVVIAALEASGLDPSLLELELTESIWIDDAHKVLQSVQRIRSLGVRFSIDDFGTGYSSLSYLKRFPVDKLKIDQSFVRSLGRSKEDEAIVRATIQIGHAFGLEVIAEGVENEDILRHLRIHRCNQAQGYLFSQPIPADEFSTFVSRSAATARVAIA